ncbi:MAG: hypothetical protein Q9227_002402 [Pyrenula ochraceoflavens]
MAIRQPRKVSFPSGIFEIAAELYEPTSDSNCGKHAVIVLSTPVTSVKEQSTAAYASGKPRLLESPSQCAEDIKYAVTYLSSLAEVDEAKNRCRWNLWEWWLGPFRGTDRRAYQSRSHFDQSALQKRLEMAGKLRIKEMKGSNAQVMPILPENPDDVPDTQGFMFKAAARYYKSERENHPRRPNSWATRSVELMANYDS